MEADLNKVFDWYEETPSLWVAIITGVKESRCESLPPESVIRWLIKSNLQFCAGQDLESEIEVLELDA